MIGMNILVDSIEIITISVTLVVIVVLTIVFILSRLKKCPPDKLMVIYGKVTVQGKQVSAVVVHGGVKFITPFVQAYQFLDLKPISINVEDKNSITRTNEELEINVAMKIAISSESPTNVNAAERLLGLKTYEIQELATGILIGQIRRTVVKLTFTEIINDRDGFIESSLNICEEVLNKVGLRVINANFKGIKKI